MKIVGVVHIKKPEVKTRSGSKNGRTWTMKSQEGFIALGDEVRLIEVMLPDDHAGYPVGKYNATGNLGVDQYGRLTVPRLLDLSEAK